MPEKAEADSILEVERQKLGKYYSDLRTEYNSKVQALMSDTTTSKQSLIYQNKVRDLQSLEARLNNYEKEANQELEHMRSKMYEPIKLKMEQAINTVADEKGYDYILDQAFGNIVFVKDEKNNIMPFVKGQLGLK